MSDRTPLPELSFEGKQVFYDTIALVFQSCFYGASTRGPKKFAVLTASSKASTLSSFPSLRASFCRSSSRALHCESHDNYRSRRKQSARNLYLLAVILVPFVLSTAYWIIQFVEQMVRIRTYFIHPDERHDRNITHFSTLFNAIILLNVSSYIHLFHTATATHTIHHDIQYIISDSIVVWRAYALCREDYRRILYLPIFLLSLTTSERLISLLTFLSLSLPVSILTTIGIRIGTFFTAAGPGASKDHPIIRAIDIFQVSNYVWSFLTNVTATCIVSHKAWYVWTESVSMLLVRELAPQAPPQSYSKWLG